MQGAKPPGRAVVQSVCWPSRSPLPPRRRSCWRDSDTTHSATTHEFTQHNQRRPLVETTQRLSLVRLRRGSTGLALRLPRPAAFHALAWSRDEGAAARRQRPAPLGRLRDLDLPVRLGHGRVDLRRAGRPHRAREDDDDHDPDLLALHGIERAIADVLGFCVLPLHNRAGRGRRVRGGRSAAGRGDAGQSSLRSAWLASGALCGWQHLRRTDWYGHGEPRANWRHLTRQFLAVDVRHWCYPGLPRADHSYAHEGAGALAADEGLWRVG